MGLDQVLERLERERSRHAFAGAASEEELLRLEQTLGTRLPTPFRAFLQHFGGALLFDRHEIFGPRRVMIHDIDLVPDILSVLQQVKSDGYLLPPHTVPVHRSEGRLHLVHLREGDAPPGRVISLDLSRSYPDFVAFLDAVVLPPA